MPSVWERDDVLNLAVTVAESPQARWLVEHGGAAMER